MSDITLSKGVRQNLLSLQNTAVLLGRTQERLSTGKKVNSALDNPINFFTASGLQSRAGDLGRLLDSVSNAVQTLQAADKGISSIQKLIESASATARQALTAAASAVSYELSETGNIAIGPDVNAAGQSAAIAADVMAAGVGDVAIAADVQAAGAGTVSIDDDVVSATSSVAFNLANFNAEEFSTATIDLTNFLADFDDLETISFELDSQTYTFTRDDNGANGGGTFVGDPLDQAATIAAFEAQLIAEFGANADIDITGTTLTITSTIANESITLDNNTTALAPQFTGYQAADTFTINDGTDTTTVTYVTGGGNGTTTFSNRAELLAAINSQQGGAGADVTAIANGGQGIRLIGGDGLASFTVGGNAGTALGANGLHNTTNYNNDLAALAGQTLTVSVNGTETDIVISANTTRDSLVTALDNIAGLNATASVTGEIELEGATAGQFVQVSGNAATALGFGANNTLFTGNADIEALFGETVTFTFGDDEYEITFGIGQDEVASLDALVDALNVNFAHASISVGGELELVAETIGDAITVSGSAAAALGFDVADDNTTFGSNADFAALYGESVTFTFGDTDVEVNFGTGADEVHSRAQLVQALAGYATLDNATGVVTLTAQNNVDSVSVTGDADALAALGFTDGETFDPTNAGIANINGQFTIQVGNGPQHVMEFGNGAAGEILNRAGLEARIAQINGGLEDVEISITAGNFLSFESTSSEDITISGGAPAAFGIGATVYTPDEDFTVNATRASLQEDFNKLLTQITELASDASFNGINLLNGDNLTVTFNEDGSSTLQIAGVSFSAAGLGLTPVAGPGFQENAGVQAALAQLDAATATLRAQASKFGSNLSIVQTRQDFTKNMINVLQIGADNLVLADTNEEGANMLALNTRQQLSTTALSLAAQADQNVLRLF